jgi:hypothetical protein
MRISMNYKKYFFHIILLFWILSINSFSNAQEADQSYIITVIRYIYDKDTKEVVKKGHSVLVKDISQPVPIELSQNSPTKGFSGIGGTSRGLKVHLDRRVIEKKLNIDINKTSRPSNSFNLDNFYNRTWFFYIQPIIDENYQITDTFFSIEYQEKMELKSSDNDNLFKIKRYVFSENELRFSKEFNYTNDNIHIDRLVPNDQRVKLLLAEDEKSILFVTFKAFMGSEKEKQLKELKYQNKKSTIVRPRYDIKYQNSEGHELILKNIRESHHFEIKTYVQEVINPSTSKKEKVNHILIGKIIPLKYESKIQLLIRHEKIVVDKKGNERSKGSFDYSKTIAIKSDDVVEIKLPNNWPEIHFDYPYLKSQKDGYNRRIEEQSLFIKPVKMDNLNKR